MQDMSSAILADGVRLTLPVPVDPFQSDEVCLEAQIQNVTPSAICMETVSLEPSPLFDGGYQPAGQHRRLVNAAKTHQLRIKKARVVCFK